MTVVVDSSAVVTYLLNLSGGDAVRELLRQEADVPRSLHLLDAEVGNSLRRIVLQGRATTDRAVLALNRYLAMPCVQHGHGPLMSGAWQLRDNLSFYDALYVALAAKLDATLITFDQRLASAPGLPAKVVVPGFD